MALNIPFNRRAVPPGETLLFASQSRLTFTLRTTSKTITCGSGQLFLTNKRFLYVPDEHTESQVTLGAPAWASSSSAASGSNSGIVDTVTQTLNGWVSYFTGSPSSTNTPSRQPPPSSASSAAAATASPAPKSTRQTFTTNLISFSAPITHLTRTNIRQPLLGPNLWTASGTGVPSPAEPSAEGIDGFWEIECKFYEGGALEWWMAVEAEHKKVRARREVLRERMRGEEGAGLPRYEEEDSGGSGLPGYEEAVGGGGRA